MALIIAGAFEDPKPFIWASLAFPIYYFVVSWAITLERWLGGEGPVRRGLLNRGAAPRGGPRRRHESSTGDRSMVSPDKIQQQMVGGHPQVHQRKAHP